MRTYTFTVYYEAYKDIEIELESGLTDEEVAERCDVAAREEIGFHNNIDYIRVCEPEDYNYALGSGMVHDD